MNLKAIPALVLSLVSVSAFAQSAPATGFTANVGVFTDYIYRGISQNRMNPAVQAGLDYSHSSGLYAGAWASQISWIKDAGYTANGVSSTSGPTEIDLYFGTKFEVMKDINMDIGMLSYQYVGNTLKNNTAAASVNADTNEVYAAVSTGAYTAKYSYSTGNIFGFAASAGSNYWDLSATYDLGSGFSLVPHAGRQSIIGTANASYNDFSLTVAKDFGNGVTASLLAYGTSADRAAYTTNQYAGAKFLGDTGYVAGLKYSF